MGNVAVRFVAVIACVLVVALVLVGCQSQPAPAPTQPPAKAPAAQPTSSGAPAPAAAPTSAPAKAAAPEPTQAPQVLKIGILTSLSGPSARNGMNGERFIRLAMDDINAKGGLNVGGKAYLLEGVTVDDKSSTEGGKAAGDRLVLAEKVKFIVGGLGDATAAAQAVTEKNKVILMGFSTPEKFIGPKFPYTFVSSVHPNMRIAAYYSWLKKNIPQMKTVGIVRSNDAAGVAYTPVIEAAAKDNGFQVAGVEYYPMDARDFAPLITRLLRLNPDGIDYAIAGRGQHMLAMSKLLKEQEFKGPTFGVSADVTALREGAANMEGLTTPILADWRAEVVSPAERDVFQRYVQKFPETEMEPPTIVMYAAVQLLTQAMVKAGTVEDTEKILNTLRDGQWDSIFSAKWGKSKFVGEKTFGAKLALEQPLYLSGVRNGKVVTFDEVPGTTP